MAKRPALKPLETYDEMIARTRREMLSSMTKAVQTDLRRKLKAGEISSPLDLGKLFEDMMTALKSEPGGPARMMSLQAMDIDEGALREMLMDAVHAVGMEVMNE